MAPKPGKKFCAEHGVVQAEDNENLRTPCPYDPKHSCCVTKMEKHLRKCNSRPKELPPYIMPMINSKDDEENFQDEVYSINSIPNNVLMDLVGRIEKVYKEEGLECGKSILNHPVVDSSVDCSQLGMNTKKHFIQNSSLLKNMEENGFFNGKATFIEFGAGRGHLGFWITQAMGNNENCSLLLIDKASHRHKSDNKLKGVSPVRTLRIRADIADVDLSNISFLTQSENDIYGVTKHLCGTATDLALRCITNGKSKGLNIKGVTMAFCCHHRCTWSSFVGKKFLLDVGFTPNEFSGLCSISSWATCGSGKPRKSRNDNNNGDDDDDDDTKEENGVVRYKVLGLSQETRESVGRKCKMILNHARVKYLEKFGFDGKLIYYVEQNVSPENVCLIAKC